MKCKRSLLYKTILLLTVFLVLFTGAAACGTGSGDGGLSAANFTPMTILSVVGGDVLIMEKGAGDWIAGAEGMTLDAGTKVKTATGGRATITFFDGSTIELSGDTAVSLDELQSKSESSAKVIKLSQEIGETTSRIGKLVDPASRYEIETRAGVAAVRGSTMVVQVADDGTTTVYNVAGTTTLTAQGQEVAIPTGSGATAKVGEAPGVPEPGLPPGISGISTGGGVSISSQSGWQDTDLTLHTGDSFYVEYRGGSWTVDYRNFPYVGPAGYTAEIDDTIAHGYKEDDSVPYGFLLGKVGNGDIIFIGNNAGPWRADADGNLYLKLNDKDLSLGDNDGAITVSVRAAEKYTTTGR